MTGFMDILPTVGLMISFGVFGGLVGGAVGSVIVIWMSRDLLAITAIECAKLGSAEATLVAGNQILRMANDFALASGSLTRLSGRFEAMIEEQLALITKLKQG